MHSSPGIAAIPVALAAALAVLPVPARAQAPSAAAVVESILGPCRLVVWADVMAGGVGENVTACREAASAAFDAAALLPEPDQELIGQAFATALREFPAEPNPPAPFAPSIMTIAAQFEGALYVYCYEGAMATITVTFETCSAAVRLVAVAAQAEPPEVITIQASQVCGVFRQNPAWKDDLAAIVAGLAARATAGGDPIMTAPIDELAAAVADCPA